MACFVWQRTQSDPKLADLTMSLPSTQGGLSLSSLLIYKCTQFLYFEKKKKANWVSVEISVRFRG